MINKIGFAFLILGSLFLVRNGVADEMDSQLNRLKKEHPGISASDLGFIKGEAMEMKKNGLDAGLVINKFKEGLAKSVPPEILKKIVTKERVQYQMAVRLLPQELRQKSSRLRNYLSIAVVMSIKRGALEADLKKFMDANRAETAQKISRGLDILGDLAQMNIFHEKALLLTKKIVSENQGSSRSMRGMEGKMENEPYRLQNKEGSDQRSNFQDNSRKKLSDYSGEINKGRPVPNPGGGQNNSGSTGGSGKGPGQ